MPTSPTRFIMNIDQNSAKKTHHHQIKSMLPLFFARNLGFIDDNAGKTTVKGSFGQLTSAAIPEVWCGKLPNVSALYVSANSFLYYVYTLWHGTQPLTFSCKIMCCAHVSKFLSDHLDVWSANDIEHCSTMSPFYHAFSRICISK